MLTEFADEKYDDATPDVDVLEGALMSSVSL